MSAIDNHSPPHFLSLSLLFQSNEWEEQRLTHHQVRRCHLTHCFTSQDVLYIHATKVPAFSISTPGNPTTIPAASCFNSDRHRIERHISKTMCQTLLCRSSLVTENHKAAGWRAHITWVLDHERACSQIWFSPPQGRAQFGSPSLAFLPPQNDKV